MISFDRRIQVLKGISVNDPKVPVVVFRQHGKGVPMKYSYGWKGVVVTPILAPVTEEEEGGERLELRFS